jgi:hypothetical protein
MLPIRAGREGVLHQFFVKKFQFEVPHYPAHADFPLHAAVPYSPDLAPAASLQQAYDWSVAAYVEWL